MTEQEILDRAYRTVSGDDDAREGVAVMPDTETLADAIERFMVRLGLGGGPRYGTPEWDAAAREGERREQERRRAYLATHPDATRLPEEGGCECCGDAARPCRCGRSS